MNLGEQLDELRRVVLRDRSDQIAGDDDSMWTDESLLRYIGDAERRFARRVMCLRDGTTPKFTRVKLREGVKNYPLPEEVFAILSARHPDRDYDLQRTGHALVQARDLDMSLAFDPAESSTLAPGAPLGYHTDETAVFANQSVVTFTVFPVPDATAAGTELALRVVRVPCGPYTLKDLDRPSEIPLDYQLDVLEWAAYRAKRHNDADIGATPSAKDHAEAFENAIVRAQRDIRVRTRAAIGLRFGSNGFSWGR